MFSALFRFIRGFFRLLGRLIDFTRRLVVNLVFLLAVLALVLVFSRPQLPLPESAALLVQPQGTLVERPRGSGVFELFSDGNAVSSETSLNDLVRAVRAARDDSRISMLVLQTDTLSGSGLSKLAELREALAEFRSGGKKVIAYGERFTQGQYYLASVADEVHMAPDGFVLLTGMSRQVTYFKGALDKLGVRMHLFRVGDYKSFGEPFTRTDMSEADRTASRDLLNGLWATLRGDIMSSRKLTAERFDAYVNDPRAALAAVGGDTAQAAMAAGLVDELSTPDQWRAFVQTRLGNAAAGAAADAEPANLVGVHRYLGHLPAQNPATARVAVLVAQGSIVDGRGGDGSIGSDSLAAQIRAARADRNVRALVLRIDSPGGSATASERIRRELELTRMQGKPVVASMSTTAASGGYWIAAGADEIYAHRATVTGSIGVFGLFPEIAAPLNSLGLTVDGVKTGPFADALDPRRPMSPEAAEVMQMTVQNIYDRFIQTVATARKMTPTDVGHVAQGRVWLGEAAHKLGLVDGLGGLDVAVAAAARRAGLAEWQVVWPEPPTSLRQRMTRGFSTLVAGSRPSLSNGSALGGLVASVERDLQSLLLWNDPQDVYAHCLCEAF